MIKALIPTGLLLAWCASCVVAQQPPSARPAFSPYLNLNRRGASPGVNYYGLVRPQLTYNASIAQLQQSTEALQRDQQAAVVGSELPPTGHTTGFLNHNRYFLNRGGTTPLSGRTPAVAPTLAPPRRTR
jgi:hypothetical protein